MYTGKDELYENAKRVIAELIARERGEELKVTHFNDATKALWPLLSDETRTKRVLR